MIAHERLHMPDIDFVAWAGNTLAPTAILGWVVGIFPGIVLLAAFLFYLLQMYESTTYQTWQRGRRLRKMAKLKIAMAKLDALELLAHPINRADIIHARHNAEQILEAARAQAERVIEAAKHPAEDVP